MIFKPAEQKVIFISKELIKAARVTTDPQLKILSEKEWPLEDINLPAIFKEIKSYFKSNKARLVLEDSLVYLTQVQIPTTIKEEEQRKAVHAQVEALIPELLTNTDWDYKIDGEEADKFNATVFAPVKGRYEKIKEAAKVAGLELEAIEPQSFSIKRNENALLGLALKKDIKGKDSEVMNLAKTKEMKINEKESANTAAQSGNIQEKKAPNKKAIMLGFGIFTALLLIGGGIYLVVTLVGKDKPNTNTPVPIVTPQPTPQASPASNLVQEASPSAQVEPVEEVDLADYTISVLNGSGTPGVAALAKEALLEEGFETITTGNAASFTGTSTLIEYGKQTPQKVLDSITTVLEGEGYKNIELRESETLTNGEIEITLVN